MVSAVAGVVLLYLSNALSASAGLGGGSLNVPIYINVFGFSYHNATILSLCALMGRYAHAFTLLFIFQILQYKFKTLSTNTKFHSIFFCRKLFVSSANQPRQAPPHCSVISERSGEVAYLLGDCIDIVSFRMGRLQPRFHVTLFCLC